jgi:NDP-sugar pyrophosphorylase family protein
MKHSIILAGGRGERLLPLTQDRPKCMVEVLGNPIMAYQLRWLATHKIEHVVVACGYLHESIQEFFGNGSKFGLKIDYIVEDKPLGRGGAIKRAWLDKIPDAETVLCLNGDNICNLAIDELLEFHRSRNGLATILTTPLRSPYGIVDTSEDGIITGFSEKPELPYNVNAGIYVMSRGILEWLPDVGDHEVDTFPKLAEKKLLMAFKSSCFWKTCDTVKDVNELKKELEGISLPDFFQIAR